MAAKPKVSQPATPKLLKVYKATLGSRGNVNRGAEITPAQAVLERRAGWNIVVCDGLQRDNAVRAEEIEKAVGPCRWHNYHPSAGENALPHFQQQDRSRQGHSFYETDRRKAKDEVLYA